MGVLYPRGEPTRSHSHYAGPQPAPKVGAHSVWRSRPKRKIMELKKTLFSIDQKERLSHEPTMATISIPQLQLLSATERPDGILRRTMVFRSKAIFRHIRRRQHDRLDHNAMTWIQHAIRCVERCDSRIIIQVKIGALLRSE